MLVLYSPGTYVDLRILIMSDYWAVHDSFADNVVTFAHKSQAIAYANRLARLAMKKGGKYHLVVMQELLDAGKVIITNCNIPMRWFVSDEGNKFIQFSTKSEALNYVVHSTMKMKKVGARYSFKMGMLDSEFKSRIS